MSNGKCSGVLETAQETLVLAFKVGEATLLDSPEAIERILKDPKVRKAIEDAATKQAKHLVEQQRKGQAVGEGDVKASAGAVGKAAGAAVKTTGLRELEKTAKSTSEFRELEKSLRNLECAWKKSPVGVWIDKHKGFFYVVGAGLALQGAVAMYQFRSGDKAASIATALGQKLVKFKVLGNVEIAAKEIKFTPSKREVGTTVMTTAKWERVTVKFEAGVTFQEGHVTQAGGRGEVAVKVVKGLDAKAHGAYSWQAPSPDAPWHNQHRYDLGLSITYKKAFGVSRLSLQTMMFATQDATVTKHGGKAGLDLKLTEYARPGGYQGSVNITANVGANETITRLPPGSTVDQTRNSEVTAGLGIAAHF